jgi:DNA-binding MltR family transcriptional regulator
MSRGNLNTPVELSASESRLIKLLKHESDRGVALIGANFLHAALTSLLRAHFVVASKSIENFFDKMRPLSSFAACIEVAYCVGLISQEIRNDLDVIRDICNDFAHELGNFSFETLTVIDRCKNLHQFNLIPVLANRARASARDRFTSTVVTLWARLVVNGK